MQKQLVIGNLGQDPDLRTIKGSDRQVATFSVASNDRRGNGKVTTWFKVNTYGNSAKACAENLRKGDPVFVEGPIKAEPYIRDADGKAAVTMTIDATNVTFLPKNRGNGSGASAAAAQDTASAGGGGEDNDDPPF
jgi:single-strand DNA-binding protein